METIDIEIVDADKGGYASKIDGNPEDGWGVNPDEALGYAIRQLWLSGTFDGKFVLLNIVLPQN